MNLNVFSLNGQILDIIEAKADLSSIEFNYGFGVYETMKIRNGKLFFVDKHSQRLLFSAKQIFLQHNFDQKLIQDWIKELSQKLINSNEAGFSCNLKILLIGSKSLENVKLYIIPIAPFFVERKKYKTGCEVVAFKYSRWKPQAKSLNMLPSYVYFCEAKRLNFYDCLFFEADNEVTEGSRTNFFALNGKTIYSANFEKVLNGITRQTVLEVAFKNNYKIEETKISLEDLKNKKFESVFLTSTSTKVLPIKNIYLNPLKSQIPLPDIETLEKIEFEKVTPDLKNLMSLYDNYLDNLEDF
jgi:branched-subunit amino acid aminotransferase/4-amino-4-deoxychorismate lyase